MDKRAEISKRLKMYYQCELMNVVLMPGTMFGYAIYKGQKIGWTSVAACVPMCTLLLIGGLYWLAKYKAIHGKRTLLPKVMARASVLQWPLCIMSVAAFALVIAVWVVPGITHSTGDKAITSFAGIMALLEYINYYHRQLQHFDRAADFKRLLAGKGFRPAQMAVDLRKWRARR
ncbi:MAG: hypothetical protein ACPGVT_03760 [Maricaulaceae bacterium]